MSVEKPMPCQSSSVMNGRNGWNRRMVCDNTKSITASVFALRATKSFGSVPAPGAVETAPVSTLFSANEAFADAAEAAALPSTALLASTYQSQYSFQKNL